MARVNILPDTCAWIDFFRGTPTPLAAAVEQALLDGTVVTCGVVLYELNQGIRNDSEKEALQSAFQAVPMLDLAAAGWVEAARLSSSLRLQGHTLPMSDVLIAYLAKVHGATVLTVDAHFTLVPDLRTTQG